ncbi:MAG: pentapeptide repeat-containing protein [Anaerolineae bacterium]|nr:pentapeptide repeat-containing protein [Anaerolineae bacterium]
MANEEHLAILKQGVEVWNAWREENPTVRPILRYADLRNADLAKANFERATLHSANLNGADLREAVLKWTTLRRAKLVGANLYEANLYRASLRRADLSKSDLRCANLRGAYLWGAKLSEANLIGADLRNATLAEVNVDGAILRDSDIFGVSVWGLKGNPRELTKLNIAPRGQSPILVDDLETAQFIHLLLNHEKLRNVINAVTQKGVLLLGRFSDGGLDTLQAIADKLRALSYLPIIFDFDRPDDRDYTETILTLAGLSRFVIADLSGPSVPQELAFTVPNLGLPFVFINERGRKPYSLVSTLYKYPWVLGPPIEYPDKDGLVALLEKQVIGPAEEKHRDIQLQKARDLLAGG